MKAVYITEHGGLDVLRFGDFPEPTNGPNDVIVQVAACAVNRLDIFTRLGARGTQLDFTEPRILGGDVAGDVVEIGSEVTNLRTGDRVVVNPRLTCGQCSYCIMGEPELCTNSGRIGQTTGGGYAEFIRVPAVNAVRLPDVLSYEQAACLPTTFVPCWNILLRKAKLKPWETVLILSASSGVGTAGVQVAKNIIGATVIATTSTDEKVKLALDLGADEVINYSKEDIKECVKKLTSGRGVDVVLDHVGSDFWPASYDSLAPGGRYGICGVTTGYRVDLQIGLLFLRSQTLFGVFMGSQEDLMQIVEMAGRGLIRPVIHKTFRLEDAAKAHQVMESRDFFGKLVLTMK